MLGLAFHPDYASNGQFFVHYNDANGDIVIARYTVSQAIRIWPTPTSADGDPEDPAPSRPPTTMAACSPSVRTMATSTSPSATAAQGSPPTRQKKTKLLGKILRIDVDGASGDRNYAIPADNPFAESRKARPEIWAYGLRNPFRFSFDRETGDMFIGDVGQGSWEEIDFGPARARVGSIMAGTSWKDATASSRRQGCDKTGLRLPIHEYSHKVGNVVTGGYVYRGDGHPGPRWDLRLHGFRLTRHLGLDARWDGQMGRSVLLHSEDQLNIASFGESDAGELFAVDLVKGALYLVMKA